MWYMSICFGSVRNVFKQPSGLDRMVDIGQGGKVLQPASYSGERYEIINNEPSRTSQDLEDFRRVRFEEYASAAVFGLGIVIFGYGAFTGINDDDKVLASLLNCYIMISCGSLARSSFEQGGIMSAKVSELERKLGDNQL